MHWCDNLTLLASATSTCISFMLHPTFSWSRSELNDHLLYHVDSSHHCNQHSLRVGFQKPKDTRGVINTFPVSHSIAFPEKIDG
mmetsp:Transcript_27521/g.41475  ORF Transcript_27521/g.41475 Transcript_27521/m.41475 type:complete len:84 (+) Transcript_27521:80-331(+)